MKHSFNVLESPRPRADAEGVRQIRRDRRLAISLILPPTLQLLLFGFALSATVSDLKPGRGGRQPDPGEPGTDADVDGKQELPDGGLLPPWISWATPSAAEFDAGVVIPHDFARDLERARRSTCNFC